VVGGLVGFTGIGGGVLLLPLLIFGHRIRFSQQLGT
jgi:uncharacterized membrane protein YfcA